MTRGWASAVLTVVVLGFTRSGAPRCRARGAAARPGRGPGKGGGDLCAYEAAGGWSRRRIRASEPRTCVVSPSVKGPAV